MSCRPDRRKTTGLNYTLFMTLLSVAFGPPSRATAAHMHGTKASGEKRGWIWPCCPLSPKQTHVTSGHFPPLSRAAALRNATDLLVGTTHSQLHHAPALRLQVSTLQHIFLSFPPSNLLVFISTSISPRTAPGCCGKHSPQTSSIGIPWKLSRNAEYQPQSQNS